MKKIVLTSVIFLSALSITAQTISVSEQSTTYSVGAQNALTTTIYQNSKDDVISRWKNYLKDFKNEKIKMEGEELFGDNIVIKEWGNNPVDIYTRFEENKEAKTVKLLVAFNLGGAWLTSTSDAVKYASAEKMLKDFATKTTKAPIEEKLKVAEKLLLKLESDQKDLEKDNRGLRNDIEDYKKKISKAEEDIKTNEANQSKKKAEIDAQKTAVEQVRGEAAGVN
jgi:peptidoglycan hydrolase CwlO-like protein